MKWNRAFAAFLPLLVVACTSSGAADPTTPPTTSASAPSPSAPVSSPATSSTSPRPSKPTIPADVPRTGPNTKPGEKPPVMPAAATRHTRDGAKAFAEFFIRTIDWGYATVSGNYMRHYSLGRCKSCSRFFNGLDADRRAGLKYIGGRTSIVGADVDADSVVVTVDITSFEKVSRTGQFVSGEEAHKNLPFVVHPLWHRSGWQVSGLAVQV